ncbi:SDR family oxidoreductase [Actinoplanes sp. CA-030573]|uniref:SDR family oxidoreductase n=1 Tax=Actinoplanes sp. CA-030573 TaxID=3239898 RepID=UPI003D90B884
MSQRMVITGASGHFGRVTAVRAAKAGWDVVGTYLTNATDAAERLDIRDRDAVDELIARVRPGVVVHTAAGRDDWQVIADGAAHVAVAAVRHGARLVHLSSEAVFSGKEITYDEDARPDPIYRYGAAKAAGETAVRAVDPRAAVVRTSLIVGHGLGGHERLTHDLVAGRAGGLLFTDQIRKPIHVDDLADAVLELAVNGYAGVLNVAGADVISRYELGVLVARRDGLDPERIPHGPIPAGLAVPADLRLTIDRAAALLETRLRGCHEFMRL